MSAGSDEIDRRPAPWATSADEHEAAVKVGAQDDRDLDLVVSGSAG